MTGKIVANPVNKFYKVKVGVTGPVKMSQDWRFKNVLYL